MGLLLVPLGFVAGAIPFGAIVARRLAGVDIRAHGSGNIGASNVARVVGVVPGLVVLALDAAKGALPTLLAHAWCGDPRIVLAIGAAAILGHCFSPFLGFRGGKGVATSLGVFAVLAPGPTAVAVVAFAAIYLATRVPAIGSLSASVTLAAILVAQRARGVAALAVGTTLLLIYTHRGNLAKLVGRR